MNEVINKDKYQEAIESFEAGNFKLAEKLLKELLAFNNADFDALHFISVIKMNQQNYYEAVEHLKKAVQLAPAHKTAFYNLGLCYQSLNLLDEAMENYQRTLDLDPGNFDAINNLGVIYLSKKEYVSAESFFKYCLTVQPNNHAVINNLGNICMSRENYSGAASYYAKALQLEPGNPDYNNNLGKAYTKTGENDRAKIYFEKALAISPGHYEAYACLGNLCFSDGQYKKAEENFNLANNDPRLIANNLTNIGVIKLNDNKAEESIEYFNKALKVDPGFAEAEYNRACTYLLLRNFSEGFSGYESRLRKNEFKDKNLLKPLPPGIDICGKRILIRDEQGLGDSIQFARLIPLLHNKGAYTIFHCNDGAVPLFKGLHGIDEIYFRSDEKLPEYDYEIYLLSLLNYFKINPLNFPSSTPYINAEDEYLIKWKTIIGERNSFKIGIVWAGNPKHTADKKRSCRLKDFHPLFNLEGVEIFSLQKGQGTEQTKDFIGSVTNLDNYINSFLDTSAAIHNLDLVITVDTSVAHLAGAMGKKTWLLLPFIPDWRWMLECSDSPWYPSMKLFRQKWEGDWKNVFEEVRKELAGITGGNLRGYGPESATLTSKVDEPVYLALSNGENFGWGVCSKYIKKELSKKINTVSIDERPDLIKTKTIPGKIFHSLADLHLNSLYKINGDVNIGYTFFENELTEQSLLNSKNYDLVLAGSTWCRDKLVEKGIVHSDVLIQGIDPEIFYPGESEKNNNLFIIFSGGKFEYRKGQDLVLKAVKILQQKYDDIILVNAWYNLWPQVLLTMNNTSHINFGLKGNTWEEVMDHIYQINDINPKRIFTLPLVPNNKLRELYLKSDIGLFPNRCEGGTNLVLMEYMACGRPAIASYNSGHKDILTEENSLLLNELSQVKLYSRSGTLEADWSEPHIEDIVNKIEYAYHHRDEIKKLGSKAAADMKKLTWEKTAHDLLKYFNKYF